MFPKEAELRADSLHLPHAPFVLAVAIAMRMSASSVLVCLAIPVSTSGREHGGGEHRNSGANRPCGRSTPNQHFSGGPTARVNSSRIGAGSRMRQNSEPTPEEVCPCLLHWRILRCRTFVIHSCTPCSDSVRPIDRARKNNVTTSICIPPPESPRWRFRPCGPVRRRPRASSIRTEFRAVCPEPSDAT